MSPFRRASYCCAAAGADISPPHNKKASETARAMRIRLLLQREAHDDVARRERDVLLAVDGVAHRRRLMIPTGLAVPEILAGLGVERHHVPVADRPEHQITAGGEHAVGIRALIDGIR